MEIAEIEAFVVNMGVAPLEAGGLAPYVTNHNEVTDVDRVLVRVETDDGTVGWGEMRSFLSPEASVSVIEDGIAPYVIGRSPFEVESLRRSFFIEYTNVALFFAPIELACWDIVGKHLGEPVYTLLGGWTAPSATERPKDGRVAVDGRVDVAFCLGILPPEESADHAVRALEAGHRVLKTKAGRDWRTDVDRVIAMDEAVDGELEFRLDPNQGWRFDEAVRVGQALADAGVYLQYLEQPIRINAHGSLRLLRQRQPQPIGPNEDTYVPQNMGQLTAENAADVFVVDMIPLGGISALREAVGIAEEFGVPAAHHCGWDLGIKTAAVLHAVYGLPGLSLAPDTVYYAWKDDVLADPFTVADGAMIVPTDPGLGVTVDTDKIEAYRVA